MSKLNTEELERRIADLVAKNKKLKNAMRASKAEQRANQTIAKEWLEKTAWIRSREDSMPFNTFGMHWADVIKRYVDHLEKCRAGTFTMNEGV